MSLLLQAYLKVYPPAKKKKGQILHLAQREMMFSNGHYLC